MSPINQQDYDRSSGMSIIKQGGLFCSALLATAIQCAYAAPSIAPSHAAALMPVTAASMNVSALAAINHQVVIFVDSRVANADALLRKHMAGADVIYLNQDDDGLVQIARALKHYTDVKAVHIISHGKVGSLQLGKGNLSTDNLVDYQTELQTIQHAMQTDGDILLYGCETGSGSVGHEFITSLAAATGADVAASENMTGSAAKGGDWDLEIASGTIEAAPVMDLAAMADYDGLLHTASVSTIAQLKTAITTASGDASADTITLLGNLTFASAADAISINVTDGQTLTIDGGGFSLDGNNLTRVLDVTGGSVIVNNLTITNGFLTGKGGNTGGAGVAGVAGGDALGAAIRNAGTLYISNSSITGNKAAGGGGGGGANGSPGLSGGGGGGGFGSTHGGAGGSAGGAVVGPSATSAGQGAYGAGYNGVQAGGRGGSTSGGNGGIYAGYTSGGAGATANNGSISIGGGGGGIGFYREGGRGGHAIGAVYNTGTLTIVTSTMTNNIGAGGGGAGGAAPASAFVENGGDGGSGTGGIWNLGGTVQLDSGTHTSLTGGTNTGVGGTGGQATKGGSSSGASGATTAGLRTTGGGTQDTNYSTSPTLTSSTYNAATGALVLTATNMQALAGATNDIDASALTFTGEGGETYTLTDTSDVEISSATDATLSLSATDKAAVNTIINKNGATSTGGTTYNLAAADDWNAGVTAGNTADATNTITASGVAAPTITSASYDATTGVFSVTATNLSKRAGVTNDIVANKFTAYGEGGESYTLTTTGNVEISSSLSFTLSLSAADKAALNLIMNKEGATATNGSSYTLSAADDWAAGADPALSIADTGNSVSVSNVPVPTITSATYNGATGAIAVTATGLVKANGAANDIIANTFTITGQGGGTATLTDTANVEITNGTSFSLTLSATDKNSVDVLLNNNGTQSSGATTYNLAAAEDWSAGSDAAVNVADLTLNGITVSNAVTVPGAPTVGTATAGNGQASIAFSAPGSNGGSAITGYTMTSTPGGFVGSNTGSPIVVTGLSNGTPYTFTVTATNAVGTGSASGASNSITPKAAQTITFANPGAQNFGTTPTLSATSDSGLTPTFTSSTTGVCTITSGGALTFVTAGTCTIDVDESGNGSYLAATTVTRSFSVNAVVAGAPTIGTAIAGDTAASVAFSVPGSNGGAAITGYTVTASPGGLTGAGAGSPISVTGLTNGVAYTFTVTATNAAGTGSASGASNSITPAAAQTITFANPGAQNFGTTPTLSATSDSGLTPTFTSSTTGVCTITSGGALTFVTAGTCTIDADESGDGSYLAATTVTRSFSVNAVVAGAPTVGTATAGDTAASVAFSAPGSNGGAAITGYTVTASPGGLTGAGAGSPISVTGLTNGVAYTFTVTATNAAGTGSASGASNSVTPKATQTISFSNPGAQIMGTSPSVSATASSSLAVSFSSTTPSICSVSGGGALTLVAAGSCTVNADQAGNVSFLAAATSSQTFAVNPAPNTAPVITQGASTSVTMSEDGAPTAFTLSLNATDAESDPLTWSISSAASNGAASVIGGAVSYTPTANYNGSDSFVVTVSDGALSTSISVNVTISAVNDAPIITGTPATRINQDAAYSFTPAATDADSADVLTFSIVNKPTWATFDTATGALTGTPVEVDIGITAGIVISVSDGTLSASLPAFDLTVVNLNDAPIISGTPVTKVDQDVAYSFTPTATDVDIADVLTFSITNKPTWASFDTATGALTGTPKLANVGTTSAIVISVTDGMLSSSLAAFSLEVVQTIDPLTPVLSVPDGVAVNATALYTPVGVARLLGLAANASAAEIDVALASLAHDIQGSEGCCNVALANLNANKQLLLAPGRHEIVWTATGTTGLKTQGIQVVNVHPLISLSKSQIAVRGSSAAIKVLLNGPAPVYPLTVSYEIDASSTATEMEHSLRNGSVTFTQAAQREMTVPVQLSAPAGFSDSQLVVRLAGELNMGASNRHTIDLRGGNIAPVVSLQVTQAGLPTSQITPTGGPVTVTAQVVDPNMADTHSFDWSATSGLADTNANPVDATRVFDPAGLTGSHKVEVTVMDSAGASVSAQAFFRVVSALPTLSSTQDTDNDGINDELEGTGDSDGNGIPNYLDNMPSGNILPQVGIITDSYLLECDPGVRCGLGLQALAGNSGGAQILDGDLGNSGQITADTSFKPVGGIFDFVIRDVPTAGQSVRVVIPQQAAIPASATYRKFQKGTWVTFIENDKNSTASTAGSPGYCPPPGAIEWQPGLTAGHFCVQLTIEDGGPNDADGKVNASVEDPGVVSVAKAIEPPPVVPPAKPPVEVKAKGGGAMNGLWLLLLGGLVLLKRVRVKPLMAAVIALFTVHTQAADLRDNSYLRVDLYAVQGSQSEGAFTGALTAAGHEFNLARYDENRTGYQLALGYQWNSFSYTEIGYLDLGEVDVNLTLDGDTDMSAFAANFAKQNPMTASGASLVQGISFDLGKKVKFAVEAGLFIWQSEVELTGVDFALEGDNGVDPIGGVRLDFPLADAFTLGVGLRRIYFDTQEVNMYSVSGSFHF